MAKRTLLDISDDMLAFEELMIEAGGDITDTGDEDAFNEWFAELKDDRDEKLDGYAALVTEMTARAKIRREEAARLTNRARIDENAAKYLKYRLRDFFDMQSLKKIETRRYKISLAKNGGKAPMHVDDLLPKEIPEEFQRIEITVDTDLVRQALEKERKLPFAHFGERGTHIRIK